MFRENWSFRIPSKSGIPSHSSERAVKGTCFSLKSLLFSAKRSKTLQDTQNMFTRTNYWYAFWNEYFMDLGVLAKYRKKMCTWLFTKFKRNDHFDPVWSNPVKTSFILFYQSTKDTWKVSITCYGCINYMRVHYNTLFYTHFWTYWKYDSHLFYLLTDLRTGSDRACGRGSLQVCLVVWKDSLLRQ